ncbi:hypothetical protein HON01_04255 [Candidatus Woesearchaeota archaeon]|jgi:hypothetical protein|nr:hypothetical protein [Bacteroidota bacterium]MBT5022013.1 hypothetical protein [Candidatus Woesearchaeota archaeon]MBT4729232.1 hypothetical protein [Bacteroidota bacterium]MBT5992454.1 hypothetical protein [Bacteroidota bacterium]MBT6836805.1 hypothetical protein [Bacteroidota bacterium]
MKKIKNVVIAFIVLAFLSSCTVTYEMVTNNPMGDADGKASGSSMNPDLDFSLQKAAKKGKVDKISTVKFTIKSYGIISKYETKVTGTKAGK